MLNRVLTVLFNLVLLGLVLAGIGWGTGAVEAPSGDLVAWGQAAVVAGGSWVWDNTQQANWALVVVFGGLLLAPLLFGLLFNTGRRDPKRLFSHEERQVGFKRSGGKCEMDSFLWFRCHRPAQHGDHWFPWSKGGRSSMANFVSACSRHNLAKSNAWPTMGQTMRISMRRRTYFPRGYTVRPGEKY